MNNEYTDRDTHRRFWNHLGFTLKSNCKVWGPMPEVWES